MTLHMRMGNRLYQCVTSWDVANYRELANGRRVFRHRGETQLPQRDNGRYVGRQGKDAIMDALLSPRSQGLR